uniref:Serine protease K12H4.7 n=1 Tax=Strongyloides papillosus TaxID=174720 RepID=A0A0N5BHV6_STREA
MLSNKFIQILVIFLAVFLFLVSATPLSRKKPFNRKGILINGRPWHGLTPLLNLAEGPYPGKGNAVTGYFMNKINHFDASNTEKYKQRYWYNNKFYVQGGPVFLMLGGESAESASWVEREDLEWTSLAKEHNAMLFLLEHRYYGNSRPTEDMSTQNMKYLSSRQAIEDAAAFIKGMSERFDYTNQTRWVVFGGSYSGALAAWARQVHPELIFAAVGSSGPVQAEVDFYQYLDVVKNSLSTYSPQCSNDLEKGLSELEALVKTEDGEKNITNLFNLCDDWSKLSNDDKEYFWSAIIGSYMGVVQYSNDNVGSFRSTNNIQSLCAYHLDVKGTPIQHIINVFNAYGGSYGGCLDVSYNEYIEFVSEISFDGEAASDRAWTYQTCTEFGYYQSTDYDAGDYWGKVIDANWYVKQCTAIFGPSITNSTVYLSVHGTNSYYGGAKGYKGTNVILPNGKVDPWHALGVLSKTNERNYPVIIEGTAHCADMYPAASDDLPSLTKARKTIKDTLAQILA